MGRCADRRTFLGSRLTARNLTESIQNQTESLGLYAGRHTDLSALFERKLFKIKNKIKQNSYADVCRGSPYGTSRGGRSSSEKFIKN